MRYQTALRPEPTIVWHRAQSLAPPFNVMLCNTSSVAQELRCTHALEAVNVPAIATQTAAMLKSNVQILLGNLLSTEALKLTSLVACPDSQQLHRPSDSVTRSELARTLTLALFADLVQAVPEALRYVERVRNSHGLITLDHGAVRTVAAASCGGLPCGEAAITRILLPLGYTLAGVYPLPRLKMTGRAYMHADDPQGIAQFFVSELHPEEYSDAFRNAVHDVLSHSHDPLTGADHAALQWLSERGTLPLAAAHDLLPQLLRCFGCQHPLPSLAQYHTLLQESPEMAWISTEGQAFNHATDRVDDVQALATQLRAEGYAIKDQVEISSSGTVRQTALRAATVQRPLLGDDGLHLREFPGSFFEFISRSPRPGGTQPAGMDMRFDSSNATGIFKMTAPQ